MSGGSAVSSSAVLPASKLLQFSSLLEANTYRVKAIVERLTFIMNSKGGAIRFDSSEFISLCISLARGVDYALTINDVPAVAHRLPSLIKQNACKNGWFITADADELHKMTREFFSIFCMTVSINPIVCNALEIISNIVSRFYPQFKLCSLVDSFEAKTGYEILMSDFQVPRNIHPKEKIMLIVVRTDNLDTASCIISPPQVSFLVNGKGVDKRTNVSLDNGPQFPSDITKMLKFGLNIIQSIGYFAGTYLIALAFMRKITVSKSPLLTDYVHPVAAAVGADSEIIEGASRITLNCPISLRRIRTPVKGHLCKHHQCFDYDNYMEMNSRKPSWRCPFCNQSVSFIDLRIDQNMVKILKDVGEDVIDIVISADGSWKVLSDHNGTKDEQHKEKLFGQTDFNMESMSVNAVTEAVDLTLGEDGMDESTMSPCQVRHPNNPVSQNENHITEAEDRKPFKDNGDFTGHHQLAEAQLTNHALMTASLTSQDVIAAETSSSVLPALLDNPVVTDAVSISLAPEPLASVEPPQPNFSSHQISQGRTLADILQLQPHLRNSMFGYEPERVPIPRHVTRTPVAVQALPVQSMQTQTQTQTLGSFKKMRIDGPSSSSFNTQDSPSVACETVQPATTFADGLAGSNLQGILNDQQIRSPESQHVVSPPAPNMMGSRIPSIMQRGAGAYRSSSQPSSNTQTSLIPPINFRNHQTASRPNTGLPLGVTRELARQAAQQVQVQAGAANPQSSRTSEPSTSTMGVPSRDVVELQPNKNWRPTGRMRGSLTGNAYSAALNQYATPTTLANPGKSPEPSVLPPTSDQLPQISSNVDAQGPLTGQAILKDCNSGSQP